MSAGLLSPIRLETPEERVARLMQQARGDELPIERSRRLQQEAGLIPQKDTPLQTAINVGRAEGDTWGEAVVKRVPFIGGFAEFEESVRARKAAEKYDAGDRSEETANTLGLFLGKQQRQGDRTVWGMAGDMVSRMPAFMVEFGLTGGLVTGGMAIGGKLAKKGVLHYAGKAAGAAAGVMAQTAANPGLIARAAGERLMDEYSLSYDDKMAIQFALENEDDSFLETLPGAFLEANKEIVSEHSGKVLGVAGRGLAKSRLGQWVGRGLGAIAKKMPGKGKIVALKAGVARRYLDMMKRADPNNFRGRAMQVFRTAGFDGIPLEMIEEEIGKGLEHIEGGLLESMGYGRQGLGEYERPTMDQLYAEGLAFSLLPAGAMAGSVGATAAVDLLTKTVNKMDEISARRASEDEARNFVSGEEIPFLDYSLPESVRRPAEFLLTYVPPVADSIAAIEGEVSREKINATTADLGLRMSKIVRTREERNMLRDALKDAGDRRIEAEVFEEQRRLAAEQQRIKAERVEEERRKDTQIAEEGQAFEEEQRRLAEEKEHSTRKDFEREERAQLEEEARIAEEEQRLEEEAARLKEVAARLKEAEEENRLEEERQRIAEEKLRLEEERAAREKAEEEARQKAIQEQAQRRLREQEEIEKERATKKERERIEEEQKERERRDTLTFDDILTITETEDSDELVDEPGDVAGQTDGRGSEGGGGGVVSDDYDQPGEPPETDVAGRPDTQGLGSDDPGGREGDAGGPGLGLPPISQEDDAENPFADLFSDEDEDGESEIHASAGKSLSEKDRVQAATVIDRWINKAGRKDYAPLVPLAVKQFGEDKARNVLRVVRKVWDNIRDNYPKFELEPSQDFDEVMNPAPQMGEPEVPQVKKRVLDRNNTKPFVYYMAKHVVAGAVAHPASLEESAALAGVDYPDQTIDLNIPSHLIENGNVSDIQLEGAINMTVTHEKTFELPTYDEDGNEDGTTTFRKGGINGDGTGVGKTRENLLVVIHNFLEGRKRALYVTMNRRLASDIKTAWVDEMEQDEAQIIESRDLKIDSGDGLALISYQDLKNKTDLLKEWFADGGVIIFDEAHTMKNPAAKLSMAAAELQDSKPDARVIYASATGAAAAQDFSYARRLGLWGPGTAFEDIDDFVAKSEKAGLTFMEVVARELKQRGQYFARRLSMNDGTREYTVEYDRFEHETSEEDVEMLDDIGRTMRHVWGSYMRDLEERGSPKRLMPDGKKRNLTGHFKSIFGGAQQRFSMSAQAAIKMPSIIADINNKTGGLDKNGNPYRFVIQIDQTEEQAFERMQKRVEARDGIYTEEDLSVAQDVADWIENTWDTGVYDKDGIFVRESEASAARKAVAIQEAKKLSLPMSPLHQLLKEFGDKRVAEVSGRTQQAVWGGGRPFAVAASSEPLRSFDQTVGDFQQAFNLRDDEAQAVRALIEARAKVEGMTPDQYVEERIDKVEGSLDVNVGGESATLVPPGSLFQLKAFHGTPHEVDRFSVSKIGTGEGAQTYGWGLYFAENPEVAEEYRRTLSGRVEVKPQRPVEDIDSPHYRGFEEKVRQEVLKGRQDPVGEALARINQELDNIKDELARAIIQEAPWARARQQQLFDERRVGLKYQPTVVEHSEGGVYTVEIDANDNELLDLEQPVGDELIERLDPELREYMVEIAETYDLPLDLAFLTGKELYSLIAAYATEAPLPTSDPNDTNPHPRKEASEYLSSLGVKGIRFMDQHSRSRAYTPDVNQSQVDGLWRPDLNHVPLFELEKVLKRFGYSALSDVGFETSEEAAEFAKNFRSRTTHNYVVFDDANIKITGKNGEPIDAGALAQDKKAFISFAEDGRALIRALESPDISSALHELGHLFRRDLSGADLATAEEWAGVKDGEWDTAAEEKFARGFERYLAEGKSSTESLRRLFAKLKRWLTDIYREIVGSDIDVDISPGMRRVFDRLFDVGVISIQARQKSEAAIEAFQNGAAAKDILIFSRAGGTGASYHSDRRIANQGQRIHYILQAGWSAINAVQGLGRTHRSNQVIAPLVRLVGMDTPSDSRFVSAVMARLDSLGALTLGQRGVASGGTFADELGLDDPYGQAAVNSLVLSIENETAFASAQEQGLPTIVDGMLIWDASEMAEFGITSMGGPEATTKRVLNRFMSLPVEAQAAWFSEIKRFREAIIAQKKSDGLFDYGLGDIRAPHVDIVHRETIFVDDDTGKTTEYLKLQTKNKAKFRTYDELVSGRHGKLVTFAKNRKSKHLYAIVNAPGGAYTMLSPQGEKQGRSLSHHDLNDDSKWEKISNKPFFAFRERESLHVAPMVDVMQADVPSAPQDEFAWNEAIRKSPQMIPKIQHFINGLLLPVWDKLPEERILVRKSVTDGGEPILGRLIDDRDFDAVRERLGIGGGEQDLETAWERQRNGEVWLQFSGGVRTELIHIQGHPYIRFMGISPEKGDEMGLLTDTVGGRHRNRPGGSHLGQFRFAAGQNIVLLSADENIASYMPGGESSTVSKMEPFPYTLLSVHEKHEQETHASTKGTVPLGRAGHSLFGTDSMETGKGKEFAKAVGKRNARYGERFIEDFVASLSRMKTLIYKRAQLSSKAGAHLEGKSNIQRSNAPGANAWFHEAGHSIDYLLSDREEAWRAPFKADLESLTYYDGSHASSHTATEGLAEYIRLFVQDVERIPEPLRSKLAQKIESMHPGIAAGLRDANRMYALHMARPLGDRQASRKKDRGFQRGVTADAREYAYKFFYRTLGDSVATMRIKRALYKALINVDDEIKDKAAFATAWIQGTRGTAADIFSQAHGRQIAPRETTLAVGGRPAMRAMGGLVRGQEGVRAFVNFGAEASDEAVSFVGITGLTGLEVALLEKAGLKLPADVKSGEAMYFTEESLASIKHDLGRVKGKFSGEQWEKFKDYAQWKTLLHRFQTDQHQYPGWQDTHPPAEVEARLRATEKENPSFEPGLRRFGDWMNQLLLVNLLSGEMTAAKVARIASKWEYYVPLPRDISERSPTPYSQPEITVGAAWEPVKPRSGVFHAHGSQLSITDLEEAVYSRVWSGMNAYYQNQLMKSIVALADRLAKTTEVPYEFRMALRQMITEVRPDPKLVVTLTDEEQKQIGKETLNIMAEDTEATDEAKEVLAELLRTARKSSSGLADVKEEEEEEDQVIRLTSILNELARKGEVRPPKRGFFVESDIPVVFPGRNVWRAYEPNLPMVIAPSYRGKRRFFQVTDPLLWEWLLGQSKSESAWKEVWDIISAAQQPWKTAITSMPAFAAFNIIARDPITAIINAPDPRGHIPYYYAAFGAWNRFRLKMGWDGNADAMQDTQFYAKALENTTSDQHKTTWQNLKDQFLEYHVGLQEHFGSKDMSGQWLVEALTLPFNKIGLPNGWSRKRKAASWLFGTLLMPINAMNLATGSRWLSNMSERLPREGAFLEAKRRGKTDMEALESYDRITGRFTQRGGHGGMAAYIRAAGFLNPNLQLMWQFTEQFADPEGGMGGRTDRVALKLSAIIGYTAAAALGNMAIAWLMFGDDPDEWEAYKGMMEDRTDNDRFRYMSLFGWLRLPFEYGPVGAAQSYVWNTTESMVFDAPDPKEKILGAGTAFATISTFFPPYVTALFETGIDRSLYWDEDITPQWLEDAYPNETIMQSFPTTPQTFTELVKPIPGDLAIPLPGLGKVKMRPSPLQMRHIVRGLMTQETDRWIRTIEARLSEHKIKPDWSDFPMIGRFFMRRARGWSSGPVQGLKTLDARFQELRKMFALVPLSDAEKTELRDLYSAHTAMLLVDKHWEAAKRAKARGDMDGYNAQNQKMTDVSKRYIKWRIEREEAK